MTHSNAKSFFLGLVLFSLVAAAGYGQGSLEDYERSASYNERTEEKVFRTRVRPQWLQDETRFFYRIATGPKQHSFVLVDPEKGLQRPLFDHAKLARALATATDSEQSALALPLDKITFDDGMDTLYFNALEKAWECSLDTYALEVVATLETGNLKPMQRRRRSRESTDNTEILFINQTKETLKIYWLDFSGEEIPYGVIAPGSEYKLQTFVSHTWLVTNEKDQPVTAFMAEQDAHKAIIDSVEPNPRLESRRRSRRSNAKSPDGQWEAYITDHNVFLRGKDEEEIQLSDDGNAEFTYEERFTWSPDSTKLVVMRTEEGDHREIWMVESSPDDQLQPKLHTMSYAKPGDKLNVSRPRLFDIETRTTVPIEETLFPNPWSNSDLRWSPDSSKFTFLYNQRGHQILRIVAVDAKTGVARPLVEEESETFIDYAGKRFSQFIDESNEIIWMSERDGWNHLYLFDAVAGELKNQITQGEWVVRRVERVDEEARQIWFQAGAIYPEQDPYYLHLCRVNFDGSGLTVLTKGDGTHRWTFSPDKNYFIDTWSRVDQPPVTELRKTSDGTLVLELERGDWSELLETGWQPPERFVAKARDGITDIHGIIIRPTNFEPGKKYPVLEQIYAGPHGAFVPKAFGRHSGQFERAELGFILVQIDGMGTSYRSKAFHDVCWKNLGDSGFPDRILWMQAAAAKYPELDLERVGIYGGSAGGQSALRAMLAHGDFYKAAVADCGCHDNRMDKVWWNELWMGWPIGPHYEEQSNVTQAHKLQGDLLLIVGELDRNVDPASTLQVVDALIKADKDFEFLLVPGGGHGIGGSKYGRRRQADFFVRHLMDVKPRWEKE